MSFDMKDRTMLNQKRGRRVRRVRARIFGTSTRPRLAVFRSNRSLYAQLIDDARGTTLAAASSRELKKESQGKAKMSQARLIGELIARRALTKGIKSAVFDRRAYAYHGRVKALAEGAREGGLMI